MQLKKEDPSSFPLAHYSYSSMVKFSTNPVMFKIQYLNLDRIETTISIAGVIGNAFHNAMEVYYGGSDTLLPSNEAEAIEYGLKTGMDFLEKYNDGFIEFTEAIPNKQKAYELFAFCFNSYVQEMPYQNGTVVAVEDEICEFVDVEWRGKRLTLPVKLKGFLDKVERINGKLEIKDYKTCRSFSDPEKIDGAKMIQAVQEYLLAYAKYKEEPRSITFEEVKYTKNKDGGRQVRQYEIVYAENELYFDFYFRFYEDMTRALNGEMVYVPNVYTMYDNEVSMIAYIHRLDETKERSELLKELKVSSITELLKHKIQNAGNMRKLMKTVEAKFSSAKSLDYSKMKNEEKIQTKMLEHGMMIQFDSVIHGASVDLYRYTPSIGLKMARIRTFVDDVEQVLGVSGIRVLAPIPHSSLIGFEVPKKDRTFPSLPAAQGFDIAVGQDIMGNVRRFDIRTAPHVLVAGSTGSGKSVFLHSVIQQLQKAPDTQLYLFDPKRVEFSQYAGSVKTYLDDHANIATALSYIANVEMDERYQKLKAAGAKDISGLKGLPYLFVVIDEYADLALKVETNHLIQLIAQKGRACGIHLVLATQRASTKIISGDVKVNFPTKVVFRMAKSVDSQVMLDEPGAEKLLGKGDCLFAGDWGVERLQAFKV